MFETTSEIAAMQELLDTSLVGATPHLQAIFIPGERTLTADQVVAVTQGMCTLALATVTAKGEPRISGADGHLLHGRWVFGTDRGAAKARHLSKRPAASAAHMRGEDLGIFVHGHVVELNPVDGENDPQWESVVEHMTAHYGESPLGWGDTVYYRLEPDWMVAYTSDAAKLMASIEPGIE